MDSLIISTGSNLGDRLNNLLNAKKLLSNLLKLKSESKIYESPAILFLKQPDFLNQVLEFEIPTNLTPDLCMTKILEIEQKLGRRREIDKGPRIIDIDIIFWGMLNIKTSHITIPHYDWFNRSFICLPLKELSCFHSIKKCFRIPSDFSNNAYLYDA